MPIFSLKCFRTDTQVARNRVRGFGLLKPHTVPARIVSPLSVAFSTLSAFQVESVEQPCLESKRGRAGHCVCSASLNRLSFRWPHLRGQPLRAASQPKRGLSHSES